ncbi:MAG: hypothetical protein ACI8RD_005733 [Bacillariaceae sp.]|jgi:hypothetical protein
MKRNNCLKFSKTIYLIYNFKVQNSISSYIMKSVYYIYYIAVWLVRNECDSKSGSHNVSVRQWRIRHSFSEMCISISHYIFGLMTYTILYIYASTLYIVNNAVGPLLLKYVLSSFFCSPSHRACPDKFKFRIFCAAVKKITT